MNKLTKLGDVDPYDFSHKKRDAGVAEKTIERQDAAISGSRSKAKSFKAISELLDPSSDSQKSNSNDDSVEEIFDL